jgi:uncharacterized protein with beta-barrel porin domain
MSFWGRSIFVTSMAALSLVSHVEANTTNRFKLKKKEQLSKQLNKSKNLVIIPEVVKSPMTVVHNNQFIDPNIIKTCDHLTLRGIKSSQFLAKKNAGIELISLESGSLKFVVNPASHKVNIDNDSSLVLDVPLEVNFLGSIQGYGDITKTNHGRLVSVKPLSCDSLNIEKGDLVAVNGIDALKISVAPRASLTHKGSAISGDVNISGSLFLRSDTASKAEVDGSISFGKKAVLDIRTFNKVSECLSTAQAVTLDQSILAIHPAYAISQEVPIIQASSITGDFKQIISPIGYKMSVIENNGQLILKQEVLPLASLAKGRNAKNAASALDQLRIKSPVGSKESNSVTHVHNLYSQKELSQALESLSPGGFKAGQMAVEQTMFLVNDKLITDLIYQPNHQEKFWIEGIYEAAGQKDTYNGYYGYNDTTWGAIIGYHRGLKSDVFIQLAGAWTYNSVSINHNYGTAKVQSGYIDILLAKTINWFTIIGDVIGNYSFYDTARNVATTPYQAYSKHHLVGVKESLEFNARADVGSNNFIEPFDRVSYRWGRESQYTEHGANVYNLHVDASYYKTLRNEIGARFGRQINPNVLFALKAGYIHDKRWNNNEYTYNLVNDPTNIQTAYGIGANWNYFSSQVLFQGDYERYGWKIQYDGLWNKYLLDNSASVQLTYKW